MSIIKKIALGILIIGGVNWGLVGLFDFDLVAYIFGIQSTMTKLVYILVAISSLFSVAILFDDLDHKKTA